MKKILTAMSIVLGLGFATAQQAVSASKSTIQKTTKTVNAVKPEAAKPEAAKPTVKLKKDGTPDKRYKTNQTLKKDGTPDKRYKMNK
ncbi:hypothetical protein CHRY9390_01188 [Chryseobacterium aquaeductus]|uniref:Uncharacterized protein n=1 Tax=Chryseobacterium aquaeductus TaxID=2675056 RepID=A0A9N8MMD6_9FLAO|nr:hypothetical protein [Chryseobacterium aquaeductus]CAA7330517.1 hypothetical protein CHRY9390_01188 [Chryseobacterium potabilaquae]CAD7804190.1 hypothetical protein CHRY9390_01188 [Chryseobacterium aquaeductus]